METVCIKLYTLYRYTILIMVEVLRVFLVRTKYNVISRTPFKSQNYATTWISKND